jgi:hypothetical protein
MRPRHVSLALIALLAGAAQLAGAASPAAADDLAAVNAKVGTAMHAAKSFVLTTTTGSFNGAMTFVAPDRYRTSLAYNGTTYEVVVIGKEGYVSANGSPYRKADAPPEFLQTQVQLRDVPVDAVLPDTTVNGTVYGQFATTSAGPQHDQRLTCTYDKKTYRIARCANESLTIAFTKYDDPANAVAVPPGAAPARR